jgi:hypothetical protein
MVDNGYPFFICVVPVHGANVDIVAIARRLGAAFFDRICLKDCQMSYIIV